MCPWFSITMSPAAVSEMQKVFVAKLGSFAADDGTELKTLNQAMTAAGYL